MKAPADWRDKDGRSWLSAIPSTTAPGLAVFAYEHGMKADDSFSWQTLLNKGADLLASLLCWIEGKKVRVF